ncbi:DUF4303 domain-containing protein [Streptomyces sp. NPDC085944]|uniref:DUF4303 domain-containing protein n=1 Tax=Streptomyces sp. NPDC085944 TaxID=3154962 RepID=UPI0034382F61
MRTGPEPRCRRPSLCSPDSTAARSAWSHQTPAAESERQGCAPLALKWSCADSPLCCYGEGHLAPVRPLFAARGDLLDLPSEPGDDERALRLNPPAALTDWRAEAAAPQEV